MWLYFTYVIYGLREVFLITLSNNYYSYCFNWLYPSKQIQNSRLPLYNISDFLFFKKCIFILKFFKSAYIMNIVLA